jgi:hypothetical protein
VIAVFQCVAATTFIELLPLEPLIELPSSASVVCRRLHSMRAGTGAVDASSLWPALHLILPEFEGAMGEQHDVYEFFHALQQS